MEKSFLRKIMLGIISSTLRFTLWIVYSLGCYRSITSTLKLYEDYTLSKLKKEENCLKNICDVTGLDSEYLEKIVRVRTSAIIIKALEISGAKVEIMSSPEKLKEVIENHFGIEIQVNENGCYKYSNQSGFNWGLECSQESKRRFELFNIIMIILESRE